MDWTTVLQLLILIGGISMGLAFVIYVWHETKRGW